MSEHEHGGNEIYLSPSETTAGCGYLPEVLTGLHDHIVALQHDLNTAFNRIQELENARAEAQR